MIEENAAKIEQDQKDSIKTVLDEAKEVKDNTDSSVDELKAMTEKVQKTLQEMMGAMQG
jgi:molecular chaperone DnaK (HSP70)